MFLCNIQLVLVYIMLILVCMYWTLTSNSKDKIPFTSTQNCVYRLGCVDCDAFYIGESSREIRTRAKEHESYTKRPPNNPVELEKLQIKSAIAVHAIYHNHKIDIKNIQIIQKGFPNYKER